MTEPIRIESAGFEVVRNNHYVMTEDDVFDGRNKLGMFVAHIPLGVPLCEGCDKPIPANGICDHCEIIHADIAESIPPARYVLTERARLGRAA